MMRTVFPVFLILILLSCSAVKVNYDYDKNAGFTSYTTYNYYPDMETGLSPLDNARLVRAIDSIMQGKGILLNEEPDFYIALVGRSSQVPNRNTVGVGLGGGGRGVGGGLSVGIPVGGPKAQREIQFDFVDRHKDELFWQAVAADTYPENITPQAREKKLQALVAKVLEKYPPKK